MRHIYNRTPLTLPQVDSSCCSSGEAQNIESPDAVNEVDESPFLHEDIVALRIPLTGDRSGGIMPNLSGTIGVREVDHPQTARKPGSVDQVVRSDVFVGLMRSEAAACPSGGVSRHMKRRHGEGSGPPHSAELSPMAVPCDRRRRGFPSHPPSLRLRDRGVPCVSHSLRIGIPAMRLLNLTKAGSFRERSGQDL